MKIKKILIVLFLLPLIFSLTHCGQKGDLVHPKAEEQEEK